MTARRTVHRSARAGAAALVVAGLGLVAACGDQQAGAPVTSSSTPSSTPSSDASGGVTATSGDELTVVVDDGTGKQTTWTLTCADGVVGGDHPDAQNACDAIAAAKSPWAPVPKDMACTQVYGGAQTATVTGTWGGESVDARFARNDGCQIARWDRIAPLLQPGTPVTTRSRGAS